MVFVVNSYKEYVALALLAGVFVLSIVGFFWVPAGLVSYLSGNVVISAIVFATLMFGATIIAPVVLLPLVPVVSPILGPFVTGLACWVGWTLGSVVAFWIARYGGRPLLARFTDLGRLDTLEARIPEASHFLLICALRLIVPVDILSYALGLFSTVSMRTYALASAVSILWFSFAFSYLGFAAKDGDAVLFTIYSVVSGIIALTAFWYVRRNIT